MVLIETKKNETKVEPHVDIWIEDRHSNKFEVSDTTIFSFIIVGALIGLFFFFFSA
jgi:hypothetical protein